MRSLFILKGLVMKLLLALSLLSFSSFAAIKVGVYEGADPNKGGKCQMEVLKIDHGTYRSSVINRTIRAEIKGITYSLRYKELFHFDKAFLEFDNTFVSDTVQIGHELYSARIDFDPATNHTTPYSFTTHTREGELVRCQKLTFIKDY